MARTLTSNTSTAIASQATAPRMLIEAAWSTTVRICTRETVTWGGYAWTGPSGSVSGLGGSNADHRCTITLLNHDDSYGAIALSEGLSDIAVKVWALYGTPSFATDDAVLLFDGQMDGGSITVDRVTIDCIAMRAQTMYAPRIYAQPPLINHAPPAGTVLRWNGDTYTLERR